MTLGVDSSKISRQLMTTNLFSKNVAKLLPEIVTRGVQSSGSGAGMGEKQ